MSHFLKAGEVRARVLGHEIAAVDVQVESRRPLALMVQPGSLGIAKADVEWTRLPDHVKVVGPNGDPIRPSSGRCFVVSVESFDPVHLVAEVDVDFESWSRSSAGAR